MMRRFNRSVDKYVKEVIPTRKLISAYGGIGSIVETRMGAIKISSFEKWPCVKDSSYKENTIEDPRLLYRLRLWFDKLEKIVSMPTDESQSVKPMVAASYFPEWMYCPSCRRFDLYPVWKSNWHKKILQDNVRTDFTIPYCFHCYIKDNKKAKYRLEQVRFILISTHGNIADVPWDKWVFARYSEQVKDDDSDNVEENKTHWYINPDEEIPKDIYFKYEVSDRFNDLKGISIVAHSKDDDAVIKRQTLQGIFNLRVSESSVLSEQHESLKHMKVVIRSSNSVYYPNIIHSLFIPVDNKSVVLSAKQLETIEAYKSLNPPIDKVQELLLMHDIMVSKELIERIWEGKTLEEPVEETLLENEYRYKEYQFITDKDTYNDDGLVFTRVKDNDLEQYIDIWRVDSLKMTSVQTSYTRGEPIDRDYYLRKDERSENSGELVLKKYTSVYGKNTRLLPAVQTFGEGIFIRFNKEMIEKWSTSYSKPNERAGAIQQNYNFHKSANQSDKNIDAKFVLIHTFSHLLIKELEFLCGYPATSLQERLYISEDMEGLLIYTIAGSEGSYGGLVSICHDSRLTKVILSAIDRATDCASDPICSNTDIQHGQGVGGTNLAACYSCALLPETSCEEFNGFLDRMLLISKDYGFFKDVLRY